MDCVAVIAAPTATALPQIIQESAPTHANVEVPNPKLKIEKPNSHYARTLEPLRQYYTLTLTTATTPKSQLFKKNCRIAGLSSARLRERARSAGLEESLEKRKQELVTSV